MLSDLQCNNQINIVKHTTERNSDYNTYNRLLICDKIGSYISYN